MSTARVNDQAILRANFLLTATGVLTDPTTITCKVRTASGVVTTYTYGGGTVTKDGVGRYSRTITLTEAGLWAWSWAGTGSIIKSEEGTIRVLGSDYGL